MDIRRVIWSSPNSNGSLGAKWTGNREFLVKDAFDDNDAIMKVRRYLSSFAAYKPEMMEGSTFRVLKLVFSESGVCT